MERGSLEIKNSGSVEIFKIKITIGSLKTVTVTYLCQTYINNPGFVNVTWMPCFVIKKLSLYISKVLVNIFRANIFMCFVFRKIYS